jgi:RNA polymerase sigma-B factor
LIDARSTLDIGGRTTQTPIIGTSTGGESSEARCVRQDALARAYQSDPRARERVVAELLPMVHSVARRFKRGEEPLEDLIQVGSVGLIKALQRYDSDRGQHFVTYGMPTIIGEIRRHFRDRCWAVHVPRRVQELSRLVTAAERRLTASTGRTPTIAQLAQTLGRGEAAVTEAWLASCGMRTVPLEQPGHEDPFVDAGFATAEHHATIAWLTHDLCLRDRRIVALRFGSEMSQREIGEAVGVSQMQVSRLLREIMGALETKAVRSRAPHDSPRAG